jgi:uncharacterized protein (DUF342 family)
MGALQSAIDGPEGLGIDLPLVLLAAVGQARAPLISLDYAGAGRISFDISKDKMEATINGFQMSYYDDPQCPVTVEWVQNELKRCFVTLPVPEDVQKVLADAIIAQTDLNGAVACHGIPGSGGREPYLHLSHKDAAGRAGNTNLDEDALDIREMQQRVTVKAGQLVAEVRYKSNPVPGRNVYNEEVANLPNDELIIRVGDGIQQREVGRFYATSDGIPVIEEESISLTKVLVHEGDVNLRTGNIHFDGPVEIKGSVEAGAVVEVTGDLVIHGSVQGAIVRAQGSVTVKSGITTGTRGSIQARNDLVAEFIENSRIVCGGSLTVTKALLNSHIYVGGSIKVTGKTGVVAGGRIFCREDVVTENLGYRRGAITFLDVGADWRAARSVDIRSLRLEKVQKRAEEDRKALRELVQKSKAQTTARHKEMKEELQERLTRLRVIGERLEASLAKAKSQVTYNTNSRIIVKDQLAANMALQIAGQPVAIPNEVANVAITPKRRRGSYIVPLEEIEAEEQDTRQNGADKKAG